MNNITPLEGVEDSDVRYISISKSPVLNPFVCQHFETTVPIHLKYYTQVSHQILGRGYFSTSLFAENK